MDNTGKKAKPDKVTKSPKSSDFEKGHDPQRLIGGMSCRKVHFLTDENVAYSLDNIRLKIKYPPKNFTKLDLLLEKLSISNGGFCTTTHQIGKYRYFYMIKDESDHSVRVGLMFNSAKGKIREGVGFVEFNPNKCEELGLKIIHAFYVAGSKFMPKRFDLAIDFPFDRKYVRLVKDQRNYEFYCSSALTEYLGQRSTPGRVKVYDKTAELQKSEGIELEEKITRIELTCDADWDIAQIQKYLPTVYNYMTFSTLKVKGITKAFCLVLQALIDYGNSPESYLNILEPHTKAKIRKLLKSNSILNYDSAGIAAVLAEVYSYNFDKYEQFQQTQILDKFELLLEQGNVIQADWDTFKMTEEIKIQDQNNRIFGG